MGFFVPFYLSFLGQSENDFEWREKKKEREILRSYYFYQKRFIYLHPGGGEKKKWKKESVQNSF